MASKKLNLDISSKMDIICRRGDSFSVSITIKDSAGAVEDLSSDEFLLEVRVRATDDGSTGLIMGCTGDSALATTTNPAQVFAVVATAEGLVSFSADAATMALVPSGRYVYDMQRKKVLDGVEIEQKTLLRGSFTVKEDVADV
jgi:hypothetical protein